MDRKSRGKGSVVLAYGDRTASLEDPFGHRWYVATRKENLAMAQVKKRAAEMAQKAGS